MIQYANDTTKPMVWYMWKTVFGDSDAYMDVYFREKYRNENTLLYLENDKAMASLQMLPYVFTFCGTEIPVAYLSGVATLPEARKKGCMHRLLLKSFDEMAERGIPLAILVPQEAWLLKFYDRYGFAQTFDAGTEELPSLKTLMEAHPQYLDEAYKEFDTRFRQQDMTVQKTAADFRAIVEEARLFDFPPKNNLIGMARVVDAEKLLSLFVARYSSENFSVSVLDEHIDRNNITFSHGVCPVYLGEVDIRELAQLLLGHRTSEKEEPLRTIFPEKVPQMNFMLE